MRTAAEFPMIAGPALLDHAEPAAYSIKRLKRSIQVLTGVRAGYLRPQPSLALWHHRIPQTFDVHAFFQQLLAHILSDCRFAQHHRNDWVEAFNDLETEAYDLATEISRVLSKLVHDRWIVLDQIDRFYRSHHHRRRNSVRESVGPR